MLLWLGDVKFADRVRRSRTIRLKGIDSASQAGMKMAGPPNPPQGITGSPNEPHLAATSKPISTCTGTVSSGTPNQRATRRPLTITKPQHKLDLVLFLCSDFLRQDNIHMNHELTLSLSGSVVSVVESAPERRRVMRLDVVAATRLGGYCWMAAVKQP